MEKYRGRLHMLLLYPDNEQHVSALDKISSSYDYAAIMHNRDKWTKEDEIKNPEHKEGTNKKEHYHVLIRMKNATWNTALCKDLGIDEKFCEPVKGMDNALQYLIHYNDSDKEKYSTEEVFGTLRNKVQESINKNEKSEGEKVCELLDFIERYEGKLTVSVFARYCAENGYWAEFRRSGAIMCKIIEEKNSRE